MRICTDSNQFIFGIGGTDSASETLMSLLPGWKLYSDLGLREKADAFIGAFVEWQSI